MSKSFPKSTDDIDKIFKRAVARSMEALDVVAASPAIKKSVKNELWNCCDAIKEGGNPAKIFLRHTSHAMKVLAAALVSEQVKALIQGEFVAALKEIKKDNECI